MIEYDDNENKMLLFARKRMEGSVLYDAVRKQDLEGNCEMKKGLDRIFIDGLSGMAQGLFATLIIGTIIQQLGALVAGNTGAWIVLIGKVAAAMTGAGIGVGVARKFEASQLVVVSAATAGMVGAFAGKILSGEILQNGAIVLAGPGEPLGAFVAAYLAIEV